jgi:hypothetical protein
MSTNSTISEELSISVTNDSHIFTLDDLAIFRNNKQVANKIMALLKKWTEEEFLFCKKCEVYYLPDLTCNCIVNRCQVCNENLGNLNPRQLCGKSFCLNQV